MDTKETRFSSSGTESTENALVAHFNDSRITPDRNPTVDDFEPALDNESFRQHSFEKNREAFLSVFDRARLEEFLSAQEPTKEAYAYLKRIRRFGQVLRGNYKFSDASHTPPKRFANFLRLLGDYNDRYWLAERQNPSALLAELNSLGEEEYVLNDAGNKNCEAYARTTLDIIKDFLSKSELLTGDFHTLRKSISLLMNMLAVAGAEGYQGDMHWLFSSIASLSRRLGEQHDTLVQAGLRNELDYHGTYTKVDPEIRDEFERLEPYIEKVAGI
jgi:hypothetical protein